ncbi:MAG TPA: hypothetical protein VMJ10_08495 [Kofleriaceae bacterium]|nr:hypothetical protein [Kofleriaceae bacterium]
MRHRDRIRAVRIAPGSVPEAGLRWPAAVVASAVAIACSRATPLPEPGTPDDLAVHLRTIAGADEATRAREVATWLVDEATWRRVIVEPYRELYGDYVRGFDTASAPLVAQLAPLGDVTTRRHFAGDPRLTRAQGRLRWTLPPLYPSAVAELDGTPIDTVFLWDGMQWRALVGLDEVVRARARAIDPACAAHLALAGPIGHCSEVGAAIADAAVRGDRARFGHLCGLAATLCANASP